MEETLRNKEREREEGVQICWRERRGGGGERERDAGRECWREREME